MKETWKTSADALLIISKFFKVWQLLKWRQRAYDMETLNSVNTLMHKHLIQGHTVN